MRRLAPKGSSARGALVLATGIATTHFACTSSEKEPPAIDGDDASVIDSGEADGGSADADADADAHDDDFVVPDVSVVCETSPCVTKLAGSFDGFCALLKDGRASCWGANENARLGVGSATRSLATPSIVDGLSGITHLDVASQNTCARVGDGSVYCWGLSLLLNAGAVPPDGGRPPLGNLPKPTREDAVPAAESISLGTRFACVTVSDGSLTCWGTNQKRELGRGATGSFTMEAPARATLLTQSATAVIGGDGRTFVIAPEGSVLSWGANAQFGGANFLLGRDSSEDPNERPTLVPLLSRVRSIGTTSSHSCAVAGRFVTCWGRNSSGQLGRGTFDDLAYLPARSMLADVTDAVDIDASKTDHDVPVQVVTGELHSCAVLGSGRVYCWGGAGRARLLGPEVNALGIRGKPTRIDGFSGPVVALASGFSSVCALLRSGAVECWGGNDRGQLGTGSTDDAPHPVPVRVSLPQ